MILSTTFFAILAVRVDAHVLHSNVYDGPLSDALIHTSIMQCQKKSSLGKGWWILQREIIESENGCFKSLLVITIVEFGFLINCVVKFVNFSRSHEIN